MRRSAYTLSVLGSLALTACAGGKINREAPLSAADPKLGAAAETTDGDADIQVAPFAPWPDLTTTELLVATPSRSCTTKACPGQCCNDCGLVVWKLASDPELEVVAYKVKLPKVRATECSLHYDLRAEGQKQDNRFFVMRDAQPVPSERGRRPGASAQLTVHADGGMCTLRACEPSVRCCNSCSGFVWLPAPTFDAITWSGPKRLAEGGMDCDAREHVVTGTWLSPTAFEISTIREPRPKTSR